MCPKPFDEPVMNQTLEPFAMAGVLSLVSSDGREGAHPRLPRATPVGPTYSISALAGAVTVRGVGGTGPAKPSEILMELSCGDSRGETAIVTGGSSGIGQAIAIRLGEEGVNVGVNYVGRPEGAEATKETP